MSETGTPLLQWHIEPTTNATILHMAGEIDLSTGPDLATAMRAATHTPAALIVIDLTQITFIGSTGVQQLIDTHNNAQRTDRQVRVVHGGNQARRTFEIAGIQHLLAVYETLDDALIV